MLIKWDPSKVEEGISGTFSRTINDADLVLHAGITGDTNPLYLDEEHARSRKFGHRFAPPALVIGIMHAAYSAKIASLQDGVVTEAEYRFFAPLRVGDTGTARATVSRVNTIEKKVTVQLTCTNQLGGKIAEGHVVLLPAPPLADRKSE
ncbi:MAG: hypothetical protein GXP49_10150 [Deltaproteobacteria bacterium]|nr:hypothetical protein [Deltaproteobacteria bacterium]